MDPVFKSLTDYGYAGLFGLLVLGIVGLPVPDETLLVFAGYLISRGRLNAALTFASAFLGSACGTSASYWIGRTLGHTAVLRFGRYVGFTQQRRDFVHHWFRKRGEWLLAFGYFVPGIRHFTALVAGTSELEFTTFAAFAWSGAAVWVGCFLTLGYVVGENWVHAMALVHRYTAAVVAAAVVILLAAWWLRRKLGKSQFYVC
jgi:membrane protein DedA with SNARE-associated domain